MRKRLSIFGILYLIGFTAGIFSAGLLEKVARENTALLGICLNNQNLENVRPSWLFENLLKMRGEWFLFSFIGGMTPAGILIVFIECLWLGLLAGYLIVLFFMEYGIIGLVLCVGCGVPQILFYIPSVIVLFLGISEMSLKFWKRKYWRKEDYQRYVFFMTGAALVFLLGIFLECYVNPNLLKLLLS